MHGMTRSTGIHIFLGTSHSVIIPAQSAIDTDAAASAPVLLNPEDQQIGFNQRDESCK